MLAKDDFTRLVVLVFLAFGRGFERLLDFFKVHLVARWRFLASVNASVAFVKNLSSAYVP
jgi:hypothetical protein